MNLIKFLIRNNIPVNWGTLWIGWKGRDPYLPFVDTSEVIDFARDQLFPESANSEQIMRLAALYESDSDQVRAPLFALSKSVIYDEHFELRKWRFAILIDLLEKLPDQPMYAALELAVFWSNWGFPADSPVSSINMFEYDNRENLEKLIASHESWLDEEKKALSA